MAADNTRKTSNVIHDLATLKTQVENNTNNISNATKPNDGKINLSVGTGLVLGPDSNGTASANASANQAGNTSWNINLDTANITLSQYIKTVDGVSPNSTTGDVDLKSSDNSLNIAGNATSNSIDLTLNGTIPTVNDKTIGLKQGTGIDISGSNSTTNMSSDNNQTISLNASISDLTDVNTTGALENQALVYNGTQWLPGTVSGGDGTVKKVGGVGPNTTTGDVSLSSPNDTLSITKDTANHTVKLEANLTTLNSSLGFAKKTDIGNGSISIIEGTGINVTGSNATANQSTNSNWTINLNANLSQLNDVSDTTASNNQVLTYDNGSWKPAASQTGGVTELAALNDTNVSAPETGEILVYDKPTGKWNNQAPGENTAELPISSSDDSVTLSSDMSTNFIVETGKDVFERSTNASIFGTSTNPYGDATVISLVDPSNQVYGGVNVGDTVTGNRIPDGTVVVSKDEAGYAVTLSQSTTGDSLSTEEVTFSTPSSAMQSFQERLRIDGIGQITAETADYDENVVDKSLVTKAWVEANGASGNLPISSSDNKVTLSDDDGTFYIETGSTEAGKSKRVAVASGGQLLVGDTTLENANFNMHVADDDNVQICIDATDVSATTGAVLKLRTGDDKYWNIQHTQNVSGSSEDNQLIINNGSGTAFLRGYQDNSANFGHNVIVQGQVQTDTITTKDAAQKSDTTPADPVIDLNFSTQDLSSPPVSSPAIAFRAGYYDNKESVVMQQGDGVAPDSANRMNYGQIVSVVNNEIGTADDPAFAGMTFRHTYASGSIGTIGVRQTYVGENASTKGEFAFFVRNSNATLEVLTVNHEDIKAKDGYEPQTDYSLVTKKWVKDNGGGNLPISSTDNKVTLSDDGNGKFQIETGTTEAEKAVRLQVTDTGVLKFADQSDDVHVGFRYLGSIYAEEGPEAGTGNLLLSGQFAGPPYFKDMVEITHDYNLIVNHGQVQSPQYTTKDAAVNDCMFRAAGRTFEVWTGNAGDDNTKEKSLVGTHGNWSVGLPKSGNMQPTSSTTLNVYEDYKTASGNYLGLNATLNLPAAVTGWCYGVKSSIESMSDDIDAVYNFVGSRPVRDLDMRTVTNGNDVQVPTYSCFMVWSAINSRSKHNSAFKSAFNQQTLPAVGFFGEYETVQVPNPDYIDAETTPGIPPTIDQVNEIQPPDVNFPATQRVVVQGEIASPDDLPDIIYNTESIVDGETVIVPPPPGSPQNGDAYTLNAGDQIGRVYCLTGFDPAVADSGEWTIGVVPEFTYDNWNIDVQGNAPSRFYGNVCTPQVGNYNNRDDQSSIRFSGGQMVFRQENHSYFKCTEDSTTNGLYFYDAIDQNTWNGAFITYTSVGDVEPRTTFDLGKNSALVWASRGNLGVCSASGEVRIGVSTTKNADQQLTVNKDFVKSSVQIQTDTITSKDATVYVPAQGNLGEEGYVPEVPGDAKISIDTKLLLESDQYTPFRIKNTRSNGACIASESAWGTTSFGTTGLGWSVLDSNNTYVCALQADEKYFYKTDGNAYQLFISDTAIRAGVDYSPGQNQDLSTKKYVDSRIWKGTQSEYNALSSYDDEILYCITG